MNAWINGCMNVCYLSEPGTGSALSDIPARWPETKHLTTLWSVGLPKYLDLFGWKSYKQPSRLSVLSKHPNIEFFSKTLFTNIK